MWGVLVLGVTAKNGRPTEEKPEAKLKVAPGDVVQLRDAKLAGHRPAAGRTR